MSTDPVAEANALLADRGYREPQLAVHVSPMPGRVLLKGTKIVSPFADAPDVVLRVVRERVPGCRRARRPHADAARAARLAQLRSVLTRIVRHEGEDPVAPALRLQRCAEDVLLGVGQQVDVVHGLDEPRVLFELRLQLAGRPA